MLSIFKSLLEKYNRTIPSKDMQIQVRIGIHYGEVAHQENDVFGNAVNICSRVQPLSLPGGICISGQVYDKIHEKSVFQLQKLPNPELKNVSESIEVYQVLLPWLADPKSQSKPKDSVALAFTIKQRLAVLPLTSIGASSEDEYFADGVTEELITVLSNIKDLRVIARSSIMRYKGVPHDIGAVGKELNVG